MPEIIKKGKGKTSLNSCLAFSNKFLKKGGISRGL